MKLAIGDVVKLNSGSPLMTIVRLIETDEDQFCCCVWFCYPSGQFKDRSFQQATITQENPMGEEKPK